MLRHPLVVGAALVGASALLAAEALTWMDSRRGYPHHPIVALDGDDVVLVLGFRSSRRGGVNAVQRWRTRIAVRSVPDPTAATFVFSGAAVRGGRSEAAVMADYAVDRLGVPRERVVLEEQAETTWQNIDFALPLLRRARTIRIASNTAHARRARRYLAAQAPELVGRLATTRDFMLFELGALRIALVAYDLGAGRVAARRPEVAESVSSRR
ncbi:YdcF family protein [Microbacterium fluvii]|nr:YdcF family protein [Microbacterium fluvii]MCU4671762.1 YdcF family protein [Microbacterium fluvii]